jgi:uncharacterized membrane protein YuzA (DUF378 family)
MAMERISRWGKVLLAVAIIGALNWGLVGFFNFNVVDAIFGGGAREETSGVSRFIYALVGLCGLGCLALMIRPAERRTLGGRPVTAT